MLKPPDVGLALGVWPLQTNLRTQEQMFRAAQRLEARLNEAFLDLVAHPTNPLTRADLEALIKRKPNVYGRFTNWLSRLT